MLGMAMFVKKNLYYILNRPGVSVLEVFEYDKITGPPFSFGQDYGCD